jgi:hypothetical protein
MIIKIVRINKAFIMNVVSFYSDAYAKLLPPGSAVMVVLMLAVLA